MFRSLHFARIITSATTRFAAATDLNNNLLLRVNYLIRSIPRWENFAFTFRCWFQNKQRTSSFFPSLTSLNFTQHFHTHFTSHQSQTKKASQREKVRLPFSLIVPPSVVALRCVFSSVTDHWTTVSFHTFTSHIKQKRPKVFCFRSIDLFPSKQAQTPRSVPSIAS